jgi:hypothetical protein
MTGIQCDQKFFYSRGQGAFLTRTEWTRTGCDSFRQSLARAVPNESGATNLILANQFAH